MGHVIDVLLATGQPPEGGVQVCGANGEARSTPALSTERLGLAPAEALIVLPHDRECRTSAQDDGGAG